MKMSTKFDKALEYILQNEGGLSEHPDDPGGITNHGISFRFLKSIPNVDRRYPFCSGGVTHSIIKNLTHEQASLIYFDEFWSRHYESIQNQDIINRIFDMAVNASRSVAHKLVQEACLACAGDANYLTVDGVVGKNTVEAINKFDDNLLAPFRALRVAFYKRLAGRRPKLKVFLKGWIKRGYK